MNIEDQAVVFPILVATLIVSEAYGQDYREPRSLQSTVGEFHCASDGFYADPNNCSVFYRCIELEEFSANSLNPRYASFKFQCGDGTVFDADTDTCIHYEDSLRAECNQHLPSFSSASSSYEYAARIVERSSENADSVNKVAYGADPVSQQRQFLYDDTPALANHPRTNEDFRNVVDNSLSEEHSSSPLHSESCTEDGFFPIQNDCIHFYRCVSGENGFLKYEFSCGEGTIWDPYNNVCNHRWAVHREDCKEETVNLETTQSPPLQDNFFDSKPEAGYYRPEHAGTTNGGTTFAASTIYENYPNVTLAPQSCFTEGFFADEKDCKKFYRCVDEANGKYTKYEFECGEGSVWDVAENTCNYPYAIQRSNCGSNNTVPVSEIPESIQDFTVTTSSSSSSSAIITSSSPSSPTLASVTNSAKTTTTTTSSSSSSSSSSSTTSQQMTTNSNVSQPSNTNDTLPTTPSSTSINDNDDDDDNNNNNNNNSRDTCSMEGFFPSSTKCNKFYRCVQNEGTGFTKFDFNCGPGTVWDAENNVCNHPWAVKDSKCRGSGGTTEITTTTEYPSPINSTGNNTNSPTTGNTTISTAATSSPSTTPLPQSSVTTTKSTTTGSTYENASLTTVATKPVPNNYMKCEKAGYYPNAEDCKKFYRCVDWDGDRGERFSIYHFDCPEGTIFDPSLNICNHEASVYPPRECDGMSNATTNVTTTTVSPSAENSRPTTTTTTTTTTSGIITTTTTDGVMTTGETTTPALTTTQTPRINETDSTTDISSESTTLSITSTNGGETSNETTTTIATTIVDAMTTIITSTTPEPTTQISTTITTYPTTTITATSTTTDQSTGTTLLETSTPPAASTIMTTTESVTTTTLMPTSSSPEKCPKLKANQIPLVCPTGFRRHPKQCNLFYQCTISKTNSIQIVTLSCANGTVFDEDKIQCLPPEEANEKCTEDASNRHEKSIPDNTIALIVPVKLDKSACPNEGSFVYKDDCRLFYRCRKDDEGKLAGYLYQCPEGFSFWSISKRCEKMNKVTCENKTFADSWTPILAPVENKNIGL